LGAEDGSTDQEQGEGGGNPPAATSGKRAEEIHDHAEEPFYSKGLCSFE
jgi:hypothetical protein